LREIRPTLLAWGEARSAGPARLRRGLAKGHPGGSTRHLRASGHGATSKEPAAVAAAVVGFCAGAPCVKFYYFT